jgi:hypothetical protein
MWQPMAQPPAFACSLLPPWSGPGVRQRQQAARTLPQSGTARNSSAPSASLPDAPRRPFRLNIAPLPGPAGTAEKPRLAGLATKIAPKRLDHRLHQAFNRAMETGACDSLFVGYYPIRPKTFRVNR